MTGHTEAIEIVYDPKKVGYEKLLEVFWLNIDPLNAKGQFCDYGTQYRTGIYYLNEEQQKLAEASLGQIKSKLNKPIATEIKAATQFYPAEDYHQNYYQKNPIGYSTYKIGSGRERYMQHMKDIK